MRFFIALEIPKKNLTQFKNIQDELHSIIPEAKITDLDKIHLTMAFLGEQSDDLKDQLIQVIEDAVANISPFEVTPAYIDGFPNIHYPKILWVGVKGDIDKVLMIRERVKDSLANLNLPVDERRYIPHITIAKFKEDFQVDQELETRLAEIMAQNFDPIQITSIKLFESIPNESFHSHNTLAEIQLV